MELCLSKRSLISLKLNLGEITEENNITDSINITLSIHYEIFFIACIYNDDGIRRRITSHWEILFRFISSYCIYLLICHLCSRSLSIMLAYSSICYLLLTTKDICIPTTRELILIVISLGITNSNFGFIFQTASKVKPSMELCKHDIALYSLSNQMLWNFYFWTGKPVSINNLQSKFFKSVNWFFYHYMPFS